MSLLYVLRRFWSAAFVVGKAVYAFTCMCPLRPRRNWRMSDRAQEVSQQLGGFDEVARIVVVVVVAVERLFSLSWWEKTSRCRQ